MAKPRPKHDHPVIHFEIAADRPEELAEFYEKAFGWKSKSVPGMNYHTATTRVENKDGPGIDGGIVKRALAGQRGVNYIWVEDLDEYVKKVRELGGSVMIAKIPVPGVGYVALCADPDGNAFGLWQDDKNAKADAHQQNHRREAA